MYELNFFVDYYDRELNSFGKESFEIISVHKRCINFLNKRKQKVISLILSDEIPYIFSPYSIIMDKQKYKGENFYDIFSIHKKFYWQGKSLVCFNISGFTKINFDFRYAEQYKLDSYSDILHNSRNFEGLYENILVIKRLVSTNKITPEVLSGIDTTLVCIKKQKLCQLRKHINENIGLGRGSTPEFDDFLCALVVSLELFARMVNNSQVKKLLDIVKLASYSYMNRTTMLSRIFMSYIFDGRLPKKLSQLFISGLNRDKEGILRCTKIILNDGETSGNVFLYGILKSMEVLNEKYS
ncbi:MAG: DUF2877 domain-containing protein [Endomicrobia bacterium]|nr:DUF2877 domain-containing protein [Endomicrobiia bacterium]MDW8056152.1 DUF2877 domain-containing protein [Elusimicrobiota bacterium]